jgi:outer membrane protein assembly factor BamB
VADGLVFTAGDVGGTEFVFALDHQGKEAWRTPNGEAWRGASPGCRVAPTWSRGRLFHMNAHGRLAASDARTGKELWAVDVAARFGARASIWGYAEHVVAEEEKVICMPGGEDGRVVALDAETGDVVWTNTSVRDRAAYCSPRVVTHAGVRQWLSLTQRSLISVAVETGELLWSVPFVPRTPQNALTPVYHDGHVFVACGHRTGGTLVRIAPDGRSATPLWHQEGLDDCHSGTLLIDGRLYGAACRVGAKQFYCVDFLSGRMVQSDRTLGKVALTYADGRIYCLGHRGTVFLLEPLPTGFRLVSQFRFPKEPTNTCLAHPVVADGRLYLRVGRQIHCFDISAR